MRVTRIVSQLPGATLVGCVVAASALAIAACSSSDSSPSMTPLPSGSANIGSPTATPSNAGDSLSAAQAILDDLNASRCATPGPALECNVFSLDPQPTASDFNHGLAYFGVTGTAGETETMVLGQEPSGQWYLCLWAQQFYNPLHLPEAVTICAFGQGTDVHSSASTAASVVSTLTDGTSATADRFVLNQVATLPKAAPALPGFGWYHLASPDGWVYSKYVAEGANCVLHDQVQKP